MYHDSDDEAVSGDEKGSAVCSISGSHGFSGSRIRRKHDIGTDDRKRRKIQQAYRSIHNMMSPVLVVDYDLTLVDKSSRPFPGSDDFLERLRDFNEGHNQLILYSHGSPAYINEGLNRHFKRERSFFDEIISDSSARNNKPVSHVRRVIKYLDCLVGPYVIIDDMRSNLDSDQYDVVIDITRMTDYDKKGTAVSVDYATCLRTLERGVQAFLATKKASKDRSAWDKK